MNKKLLLALQKRNNQRLGELRSQLESNEIAADEIEAVQAEVDELAAEQQEVANQLADLEDQDDEGAEGETGDDKAGKDEGDDEEEGDEGESGEGSEKRGTALTAEQRNKAMTAIGNGLSSKGHKYSKGKEKELRSAFANYIVGNIDDKEARTLGLVSGNGSVTVPDFLSREIITYAQEENFLRRYGTRVTTKENIKYPVLVEKAEAQGHKLERGEDMPETGIEFDEIELEPTEFDALATVTKKLLARTGLPVEKIVMDELKKAYVRREVQYMVRGDEPGNVNEGALAKKAVEFETTELDLYNALVKMKNTPVKAVRKKARWVLNTAALNLIETLKTDDGFPLLRPFDQAEGGIRYTLLGYPVEEEDAIDETDPSEAVFYFGDFSKFYIQDVLNSIEVQKLVELFARKNQIGFRIWNLLDAQLIYSPFEVPIYKYKIAAK